MNFQADRVLGEPILSQIANGIYVGDQSVDSKYIDFVLDFLKMQLDISSQNITLVIKVPQTIVRGELESKYSHKYLIEDRRILMIDIDIATNH